MTGFSTTLLKFSKMGEKTGWTYVLIPHKIAEKIKPSNKKSFRVKGKIDDYKIKAVALLPMGEGDFIMPINAGMRKAIRKIHGAKVTLEIEEDKAEIKICTLLLDCLEDDPVANENFKKLPNSHQQYYSKWIQSAKTEATQTKRIAACIHAFSHNLSYGDMMKLLRKD